MCLCKDKYVGFFLCSKTCKCSGELLDDGAVSALSAIFNDNEENYVLKNTQCI